MLWLKYGSQGSKIYMVERVDAQFAGDKEWLVAPDLELCEDLLFIYNQSHHGDTDPAVLRISCEKLKLMDAEDLGQESLALQEMVAANVGDPEESIEKLLILLKKLKDFVQATDANITIPTSKDYSSPSCSGQAFTDLCSWSLVVPDDFRCPISLELMKDPVIVSTGQSCFEPSYLGSHVLNRVI